MSDKQTAKQPSNTSPGFTEGSVHSHLSRLTGFMVLGLLSVMGASVVETIYIGNIGTNELAALSFTFPLVMLFQGISMGLGIGASSVIARTMGRGDLEHAKLLISHCFILVIGLIVVVAALSYSAIGAFFSLLGADAIILPLAVDYMQIWLWGLPFFTVAMVGSTLMRAVGDATTPGYLMAIGSGLQIVISPLFIFGLLGAPELGLTGAAVGFVLARFVSLLMYLYIFIFRDQLFRFSLQGFKTSCYDILHVGLPAIASNMIMPLSMAVITRLLAGHGALVVAGFGVASRIESMVMMVMFALSMSVAPFIGQNWGAGEFERVKQALKMANGFALGWGALAYIGLFFYAEPLIALVNDDPGVLTAAGHYLLILPLGMGFMGLIAIATSSFNALGKPMPSLIISAVQMIAINLPLALLGNYFWGYVGIFIAGAATMIIMGVISWLWLNREIETGIRSRLCV